MVTFLTGLHIVVCIFLIIVVLLQAGKGGGMGIAFGGGGSQTVFGSSGAGNFLTKLTSVTAFLFLVTSLGLAHYSSQQDSKRLQRLAERKADEKKVEDERAAKMKSELDKAREAAQKKPGGTELAPASSASEMPAAPSKLGAGTPREGKSNVLKLSDLKLAAPKAGSEKAGSDKAAADTKPAATDEPAKPAKPKRKRRAAPPADGETSAAPAAPAPPAEAPAAPAQ
ncbi:MAG TPA: preprotein translocase subunit SecG [Polyangia bacterium]|jgi:preprotein translocase subunit SecG